MLTHQPSTSHNQQLLAQINRMRNEQTQELTDAEHSALSPHQSLVRCMQEAIRDAYARTGRLEAAGLHAGVEYQSLRSRIARWETAIGRNSPAT